jgi:DNA-binding NtrC family response regulator
LSAEIAAGRFRADLYYRLAVVPIIVPPLRERADDVRLLIDHFLDHAAERLGRGPLRMEESARQLLTRYPWPGNVRELQNVVTRACVLSPDDTVRAEQISPWLGGNSLESRQPAPGGRPAAAEAALPVGLSLNELERRMIVATLERFGGHRGRAAAALGIGVRTLSGKLRDYGFAPREKDFAEAG